MKLHLLIMLLTDVYAIAVCFAAIGLAKFNHER